MLTFQLMKRLYRRGKQVAVVYIRNFCCLQRRTSYIYRHIYLAQVVLHFFSSFPAHVLAKRCILSSQTCAHLILHTGRGPRCLHPLLVKVNFEHSSDVPIHLNQFERVLLYKIKQN